MLQGSLETVEVKLKKVFETLDLPKERFFIFAALLGNHILSETDLKDFFSSLQVDASTKASVIEKIAQFTRMLEVTEPEKVGEVIANSDVASEAEKEKLKVLADKVVKCLRYYLDVNNSKGSATQRSKDKKKSSKKEKETKDKKGQNQSPGTGNTAAANENVTLPSDTQKLESDVSKVFTDGTNTDEATPVTVNGNGEENATISGNGTTETVSASAPASTSKPTSSLEKLLYRINPEIENVAISRHKR